MNPVARLVLAVAVVVAVAAWFGLVRDNWLLAAIVVVAPIVVGGATILSYRSNRDV